MLCGLATHRHHFLRVGVPDETWAARRILRDYCTGQLLHCELPEGSGQDLPQQRLPTESESDFSDLDEFLDDSSTGQQKMTKRKMRHLQKQMARDSECRSNFS